jgi:hypothetical protein
MQDKERGQARPDDAARGCARGRDRRDRPPDAVLDESGVSLQRPAREMERELCTDVIHGSPDEQSVYQDTRASFAAESGDQRLLGTPIWHISAPRRLGAVAGEQ